MRKKKERQQKKEEKQGVSSVPDVEGATNQDSVRHMGRHAKGVAAETTSPQNADQEKNFML